MQSSRASEIVAASANARDQSKLVFTWIWLKRAPNLRIQCIAKDQAKTDPMRLSLKEGACNMSSRFFYVQLKFTPRIRTIGLRKQHRVVVEVPKELVQGRQSEVINENPNERAIALDL